jgi:flagellar motor switch protein FliN/FliY
MMTSNASVVSPASSVTTPLAPAVEQATAASELLATGASRLSEREAEPDPDTNETPLANMHPLFERLPVPLIVSVPLREFRVRNLLAICAGTVVETQWGHGEDIPLASGDVQLAWTEFEVVDTRLAVRVTRLT